MKINSVKIENFLSVKGAELTFEDFGNLVHVVGINRDTKPYGSNGAGKSALIEAIVFGLFGKNLRKTSEKSLTHFKTKGKCRVTVQVNDNITI